MDEESKHLLKDIKKAFSAHKDEIAEKITETVKEVVPIVVNGKIDALRREFEKNSDESRKWRETQEKKFESLQKEAQPVLDFFDDMGGAKRMAILFVGGVVGIVTTIGGAILIIRELLK